MSEWIEIRLKDLETIKKERGVLETFSHGGVRLKSGGVIVSGMIKNFGNTIKVVEYHNPPYDYREALGGYLYCDCWIEKDDPEINRLFDELLKAL